MKIILRGAFLFSILFFLSSYNTQPAHGSAPLTPSLSSMGGEHADPLLEIAQAVADKISENPQGLEDLFHEAFLQKVPKERLLGLLRDYHARHGNVLSSSLLTRDSPTSGKFRFKMEKKVSIPVTLTITEEEPAKVTGLIFGPPRGAFSSIQEVIEEMRKLPGTTSFMLARLGNKLEPLYALNPEAPLAIGSTFKLYLLAALVEDQKAWNQILSIREKLKSLPSGTLHTWPAGSPITVHTLAANMISESDNTATDHILHFVGRKRAEELLNHLGNLHREKSIPFLSTMELFKLKSHPELSKRYLNADVSQKREILAAEIPSISREKIKIHSKPTAIDSIEWFASAADLCRLMHYFYRLNDRTATEIMAINPGLDIPKGEFPYVGFKGGSEPGVLNLTWILRTQGDISYALSAGWNNPSANLDGVHWMSLALSIIELLSKNSP